MGLGLYVGAQYGQWGQADKMMAAGACISADGIIWAMTPAGPVDEIVSLGLALGGIAGMLFVL